MKILALDLSKFKSVGCMYEAESGEHRYRRVNTTPQALHDLLVELEPERVVIEVSSISGWVSDLVRALELELQVVNTNGEGWRWRSVKQKHDQADALKLARLSAMNQLELVHVPAPQIRQWRAVIKYRQHLVGRRTDIKNHLRELLVREGVLTAAGTEVLESTRVGQAGGVSAELGDSRDRGTMAWRVAVRVAAVASHPGAHP